MITNVPTRESISKEIQNIFHDYEILDIKSISKMRDKAHVVIKQAKAYDIDIHDLFPTIITDGEWGIKFYQNGDVYMIKSDTQIIQLHSCYGSDSLCQ